MNVLLVHGLGRTPLSMYSLARCLRAAGIRTPLFAYSPTLESLPRIVRRLAERLQQLSRSGEPLGLVGHSLGGLLLRLALEQLPDLPIHHFVMLGSPNRSSRTARFAWRFWPFRLATRDCGRFLTSHDALTNLPAPRVPYTLIAGTAGPRWGWNEANDGIVAVSEVLILESDMPRLVPAWHTLMMNNRTVQALVLATMMTMHPADAPL